MTALRDRIGTALRAAMKSRDAAATSALRAAAAAIDNATAVDVDADLSGPQVEGYRADVARNEVTEDQAGRLVAAEAAARRESAAVLRDAGRADDAEDALAGAAVLEQLLGDPPPAAA